MWIAYCLLNVAITDDVSGFKSHWPPAFVIGFDKYILQRINCDNVTNSYRSQLPQSTETHDFGIIVDSRLNFNSHISAVVYKAHVRVFIILRKFMARDPTVLTKAFSTYRVCPPHSIMLHSPVWSPYAYCL